MTAPSQNAELEAILADQARRIAELEVALAHQNLQNSRLHVESQAISRLHDDSMLLLDTIYATAPIGLAFLDTDLHYLRINQMLADIDGLSVHDYPGRSLEEVLPQLAPRLIPIFRHVLETGEAARDIFIRGTTAAARDIPREWLASYYPVYRHDGSMAGVGAVVLEITERTRAERALRERDAWLRLAYDAAELGTWQHDLETNLMQIDERAQIHYGLDQAEMPLETLLSRIHPEDLLHLKQAIIATTAPGSSGRYIIEYRVCYPNGTQGWLSVQARVFFKGEDDLRRPAKVVGISQDITERKQIDQELRDNTAALRANEERFRMLAEQARDLIYRYRLAPEPGFEYVSPSATAITGYTPDDHYADPALGTKLVHPDDQPLLQQLANDPAAANAPLTLRWLRKDGSVIWTEQINQIIFDTEGNPVAIEGIARDITERKHAEDELRASAELRQSLSRRLVEAHERERRHIARELHDEVGQVLTGLKLTLDVAGSKAPAELAATLADAQSAINELMGRVRALSLDLRPALLDDMGLLPALSWYLERYMSRTGITVSMRHRGVDRRFPPEVETTAYRAIQEALTNVARHAGVRNASVRLLADDSTLILRVDDTGQGFDATGALTARTTGGLQGMQERAQLIGGHLTIESAPGMGTQIIMELPLALESER